MAFGDLLGAKGIAVVGASPRNEIARLTLGNLDRFPGRVVGIHPSGEPVDGVPTFASYEEAGPVDLAVVAVGAPRLPGALRTAAAAGVTSAVIPGAGANEGGREVEAELRAVIAETGLQVVGPNCMGFASLHEWVLPYVGTIDPDVQPGHVALVSQSGSVCELFTSLPWRIGFSHVVSVGNELSIDMTSVLEFLVDDPRTRAIGLFVEGIRRPDAFRAVLGRAADAGKPVVALKVGRSEAAAGGAAAHTGALAGDAAVFSGVLRDAGAIEVEDLDEVQVVLELLGKRLERPPGRVVYTGDSGGQSNLFADLAEAEGVELPSVPEAIDALRDRFPSLDPLAANPLDLWALDRAEAIYRDALPILLERQPHLVVLGLDKFVARSEPERAFVRAGIEAVEHPGSVVLLAYGGSESADETTLRTCWHRRIPVVRGASRTLRALASLARWEAWHLEPAEAREHRSLPESVRLAAGTEPWTEAAAKRLLAAAGIPVTREEEVGSVENAVAAAERVGLPVVVKISGPGLDHKTEAGGVRMGLSSRQEVETAAGDLLEMGPAVLVAEQRRADLELIVSGFVDEQFGPCALLGLGGVWTEALRESAVVAGPGSERTVRRALSSTAWGSLLLEGARGRRFPVDRVIDCALRLLDLVTVTGLATVEINPLFLEGDDVVAVDALVVPAGQPRSGNRSSGS
ncbi:MAG TPA: acetate--CoA ligase family protein [Actinomycetota bacterium]|nr:acetate--CoA ligase family protein [Actinomycetota bacterium]